jgi:acylphosphatase
VTGGRTRAHLFIGGRVQGVTFRESARELARRLGLGGWIRNLADGRVEAVFEGPPEAIERAVAWCRQGPPGARVSDFEVRHEDPTGERDFHVRSTDYSRARTR